MNGGTTFHFLDASPAQALAQARQAAAGRDIRIGGGPSTIREFLAAGLIDYAHIVVVPIVLGRGERLWDGLEALEDRFRIEPPAAPAASPTSPSAGGNGRQHGGHASRGPAKPFGTS
jgi:dihydrofolate reductase